MRAEATFRNSIWGLIQQAVICFLSIFARRIMIDTIGVEGVGLNGLLTNVVAVLSLAEMGVGSAIVFHMYKPLAENDTDMISRLMSFYRTVYRIIAFAVFAIGLCLMPFLKYIVHDVPFSNGYVMWIYLLFLLQTSTSYLFAFKRSILSADQKQYIIVIVDLVFKIVTILLGIAVLLLTRSFSLYLILLLVSGIINNIAISSKVDKLYPYLKKTKLSLQKEYRRSIFKDIKNIFIGRMSATITNSTDNILISALVGTIVTGLYSNYTIIINAITSVMNQFSYAMTGSIGNLLATEAPEYIEKVLKRLIFALFFIAAFCCVCLTCLIDPFIVLAFGSKDLLLQRYVVYICIGVFYFATVKIPVWNMVTAAGLFKTDKYVAIAGSTINLIVSFALGKIIGIAGILLGTICTYVIQYNLKIILFYTKFLHRKYFKILMSTYFYFAFTALECFLMGNVVKILPVSNPYLHFIISGVIAVAAGAGINGLIFFKKPEFNYLKEKLLSIVLKKKASA